MVNETSSEGGLIEQAIFTSAQTERGGGYQVVASSPGVVDDDLRALAVWCPSHDAMLDERCSATSVNFHPLPSGAFAVSRTATAGAEYSQRGGHRLHTHCLITPADTLRRFSNSPFALLRAAVAGGLLQTTQPVPRQLPAVRLPGRAGAVDRALVSRLGQELGRDGLKRLLHVALTAKSLGLAFPRAETILAGILNCLPIEVRTEFSFATGLRFSPRRLFRWTAVGKDRAAQRHLEQQFGVIVVSPADDRRWLTAVSCHDWAEFVAMCVARGRLSALQAELGRTRPDLTPADLPALGTACQRRLSDRAAPGRAGGTAGVAKTDQTLTPLVGHG